MKALKGAKVRPAFVTAGLGLGGSTTLLANIAKGLKKKKTPFLICSLESHHPMGKDFGEINKHIHRFDDKKQIFEDRTKLLLGKAQKLKSAHVVALLEPSFLGSYFVWPVGRVVLP
jgi:hypothetical protein